jgi:hypothetical protein
MNSVIKYLFYFASVYLILEFKEQYFPHEDDFDQFSHVDAMNENETPSTFIMHSSTFKQMFM